MFTGTMEMKEIIKAFVALRLDELHLPQSDLLHPVGSSFTRVARELAAEIHKDVLEHGNPLND